MKNIILSIILIPSSILLILFPATVYGPFLIISYIMVALAGITTVAFGIIKMIQNPNNAKKTLYVIAGLIIVFIVGYILASDQVLISYSKYKITPSTAKQVGMGLIACYILAMGTIGAVLYAELSKVFSK